MKIAVMFLFCSLLLFCNSIDEEIEAIQKAPVEERYRLMNALKKRIVRMKEKKRLQSIKKLQSVTKGKMIKYDENLTAAEHNATNIRRQRIEYQNQDILDNHIEINIEEQEHDDEEH
jgi:hypothetical protein